MSGLVKPKTYNVADSNIANLGSDLEKKVRETAAATEKAWAAAGKKPGLDIWRIEKFQVIAWPKDQYGKFYSGDSYIVLNTYKKKGTDALAWDIHFWLGTYTTQDEAGTAAYKTVELDDFLHQAPIQHREVQGSESELFMSYFNNTITLLDGGVDSGFKHVEATKYRARLIHMKGKKKVRMSEVDLSHKSLNAGDSFILDNGLEIYQWMGKESGMFEKEKAGTFARALKDERKGLPKVTVFNQGGEDAAFWKLLGADKAPEIKSAAQGGDDAEAEKGGVKKLFRLSDASGKLEFTLVAEALKIKRTMLDPNDVFIFDTGAEIFAWVGKGSSPSEKKNALGYAQDYLTKNNRPAFLPISRILQGGENDVFENAFH